MKVQKRIGNILPFLFISCIYFLTRIPFLRSFPVFYDSFEYVRLVERLNWSNITSTISSSHQPIHTFYFLTCLLFKTFFSQLTVEFSMTLLSLFFGYVASIIWYFTLNKITHAKTAFFATIITLLFPYFFIANTHILYESELLFFQILSIYFLIKNHGQVKLIPIFFSGFTLGLAHLIFIGTLYIVPIYIGLLFYLTKNNKKIFLYSLLFFLGFAVTGILGDVLVLQSSQLLIGKYSSHVADVVSGNQGLVVLLGRTVRNIVLQTIAILSPGGTLLLVVSFISLSIKKKSVLLHSILFLPFFILMQYWHAGFFGRLAIGIVFPSSLLIALQFNSTRAHIVTITILFIFFIFTTLHQLSPPPIYSYYDLIHDKKNVAIITSDYNRFLYEKYNIPHFSINGNTTAAQMNNYIKTNSLAKKTVLIDSAALRYPYFQYDGYSYHILSMRRNGTPVASGILEKYIYTEYKKIPNSDIFFLRIWRKNKE